MPRQVRTGIASNQHTQRLGGIEPDGFRHQLRNFTVGQIQFQQAMAATQDVSHAVALAGQCQPGVQSAAQVGW